MHQCVLQSPVETRQTVHSDTARTLAGSLFYMIGTAMPKERLPHAVGVRGTWSRGCVEECSK